METTFDQLPGKVQGALKALRPKVRDVAKGLHAFGVKARHLAPSVIQWADRCKADYRINFVNFVRMAFAPDLPTHADAKDGIEGYRKHPVYYACDYMRRIIANEERPKGVQGVRDVATDGLARGIATLLQVFPADLVWQAIEQELGLTKGMMTTLRGRVEKAKPILKAPKIKQIADATIVHMESTKQKAQADPKALAAQAKMGDALDRLEAAGKAAKRKAA